MTTTELVTGERSAPAWQRVLATLADGGWHRWADVVAAVAPTAGLTAKTVSNLLHRGVLHGLLERHGEYRRAGLSTPDTRSVRLAIKETP